MNVVVRRRCWKQHLPSRATEPVNADQCKAVTDQQKQIKQQVPPFLPLQEHVASGDIWFGASI